VDSFSARVSAFPNIQRKVMEVMQILHAVSDTWCSGVYKFIDQVSAGEGNR